MNDQYWKIITKMAKKASKKKEIPIGALIVKDSKIISREINHREKKHDILGHAEILAIKKASKKLKTWKLDECELYVNLKPCSMCETVIKQSRIKKVHFLVDKPSNKKEFYKTIFEKSENTFIEEENKALLNEFFKKLR